MDRVCVVVSGWVFRENNGILMWVVKEREKEAKKGGKGRGEREREREKAKGRERKKRESIPRMFYSIKVSLY